MHKSLLCLALFSLAITTPAEAQAERLVNEGCRQGTCWKTYVLGDRVLEQNTFGGGQNTLHAVDVRSDNTYSGSKQAVQWVQCSTSDPFVAFESQDLGVFIVHYINPGGSVYGYDSGGHKMYWAICHDNWNADIWNPDQGLAQTARQLGYSTQIESEQREFPRRMFEQ